MTLYDNTLSPVWTKNVGDNGTGIIVTSADLNLDGTPELFIRNGSSLMILDSSNGNTLATHACGSATGTEYVVIADVDHDNQTELLISCGNNHKVFESSDGSWASSRNVWHQYNYYPTSVNDDSSIPVSPINHATPHIINRNATQLPGDITQLGYDLSLIHI